MSKEKSGSGKMWSAELRAERMPRQVKRSAGAEGAEGRLRGVSVFCRKWERAPAVKSNIDISKAVPVIMFVGGRT